MPATVVDTNVLIGMADADDQHHDAARAIVRGLDHGELPTGHITNYIVLETLNWIHARQHHETAIETHARLTESAGFEIHQAAQKDFSRAVELFETYDELSFGDATIAAYMQREDLTYLYSFDAGFDAVDGLTRLASAENPYA